MTDTDTLGIINYSDGAESLGTFKTREEFIVRKHFSALDVIFSKDNLMIGKDFVILSSEYKLLPIDRNKVFWRLQNPLYDDKYYTIFNLYLLAFQVQGLVISPDMKVFIYSKPNGAMYQLDTNVNVVRYMTKYITLNR